MKRVIRRYTKKRPILLYVAAVILIGFGVLFFLLPTMLMWGQEAPNTQPPFPVSVDPVNKVIKENPEADALFAEPTPTEAAVAYAYELVAALGRAISGTNVYEHVAAIGDLPSVVSVYPGLRKEEVAVLFGKKLGWSADQQKQFTQMPPVSTEELSDGTISPGDYSVYPQDSILAIQEQVQQRFHDDIFSRYTPDVQKIVPLAEGLTIASIVERETSDPQDMRIISGIIWNRLFAGMKLQMDSTLQYAKATGKGPWWPLVAPRDKYIESPYNTYKYDGLPPDPISEPSTAAVLATLNPVKTSCLYYFHDNKGVLHCSDTYEQHVAALKKYFGQGR